MKKRAIERTWNRLRGRGAVMPDVTPFLEVAQMALEHGWDRLYDRELDQRTVELKQNDPTDGSVAAHLGLACEVARRRLGMQPFETQLAAAAALTEGHLIEQATGEGKTLSGALAATLLALAGRQVHVLTFNDYLSERDATWMAPLYEAFGLSIGFVTGSSSQETRRDTYAGDITYATAKQVGFDLLRDRLVRSREDGVLRPLDCAIVDEADSILIDEARIPLVIAGPHRQQDGVASRLPRIIRELDSNQDWALDESARNVHLTDSGIDRLEARLGVKNLHDDALLIAQINQAMHAEVLLERDRDYIVRNDRIELVDEFTGRVHPDRRWPDGLQAAVEAKEGVSIQPSGRILGSTTMRELVLRYDRLAGMTGTAIPAAESIHALYGLRTVAIPPNKPCIRNDHPDLTFTHKSARDEAVTAEIEAARVRRQPVLVGTTSVFASERFAARLEARGIPCKVLNARNDAEESAVVAQAGMPGAVTIATNMAGRGTDIRLGGPDGDLRDDVVRAGGLYVIGTARHESRRIDDQLRGRAGRQGDPGSTRFFVSMEDPTLLRFGLEGLIPKRIWPERQADPISSRRVTVEIDRLQRIIEGQNEEIHHTLTRYSELLERQRRLVDTWRQGVLSGSDSSASVSELARQATLHHIDQVWSEHLALASEIREGIHLVGIAGLDPLHEFHKQMTKAFARFRPEVMDRVAESLRSPHEEGLKGPAATWTYLIHDRVQSELQQMLFGRGNGAIAAGAVLMTWPLLLMWGLWKRLKEEH